MVNQEQNLYTEENILALHKEVESLENVTLIAIEELEKKLSSLPDVPPVDDGENWSPRLDVIEVYAMEKTPPLSESIRQIQEANTSSEVSI